MTLRARIEPWLFIALLANACNGQAKRPTTTAFSKDGRGLQSSMLPDHVFETAILEASDTTLGSKPVDGTYRALVVLPGGVIIVSTQTEVIRVSPTGGQSVLPVACETLLMAGQRLWCIHVRDDFRLGYSTDHGLTWHFTRQALPWELTPTGAPAREAAAEVNGDGIVYAPLRKGPFWDVRATISDQIVFHAVGPSLTRDVPRGFVLLGLDVACVGNRMFANLLCRNRSDSGWSEVSAPAFDSAAGVGAVWWAVDYHRHRLLQAAASADPRWTAVATSQYDIGMPLTPTADGVLCVGSDAGVTHVVQLDNGRNLVMDMPAGSLRIMRLARTDAGVVVAALEGVFILDGKQTRQVLPACSAGW